MKAAYFDCFAGASGDMILGALLDAGVSLESLTAGLAGLPVKGYTLRSRPAKRGAISGTQAVVEVEQERRFSPSEIMELVASATLPGTVKEQATLIFERLAAAEGRIHGHQGGEVHFHEVGAVDALVDVVGSVLGLHLLGVDDIYAGPFPSGGGTVESSHGTLPIPAPATLQLIASAGAPVRPTRLGGLPQVEMVTPTGAAILTTLASFQEPALRLERIGYGIGGRDLGAFPNVLPLWLGQRAEEDGEGDLYLLETNIDDSSPEVLGYVMEKLLAGGARDAWFTPIQMKKNRPAVMVSALVTAGGRDGAIQTLLQETSTLGVRVQAIRRHEAEREEARFTSSLGEARVKIKRLPGQPPSFSPEYDDCRRLALEKSLPLPEVYRTIESEARDRMGG